MKMILHSFPKIWSAACVTAETIAMSDLIEALGFSHIQHGKENNRIYLMKYDSRDRAQIVDRLEDLARNAGYTKIFAKIPQTEEEHFRKADYQTEARIPRFAYGR